LKDEASSNIQSILVAFEVSHRDMSPLKLPKFWKALLISVTSDVSQFSISPYVELSP